MKNSSQNKQNHTKLKKFLLFIVCCGFFASFGSLFKTGAFTLAFSIFFGGIAYYILKKKYLENQPKLKPEKKQSADKKLSRSVYSFIPNYILEAEG